MDNEFHEQYFFYSYLGDILKNIIFSFALFNYIKQQKISNSNLKNTQIPYLDIDIN